jgi:hypothetical protein
MTNLVLFSFDSHEIRVVDQDGEPWFVLRDVLDGMNSSTKLSDAVESISQGLGDGMVADLPIKDRAGRTQTTIIISEPAATYLLSRSNTLVSATESDFQFQTGIAGFAAVQRFIGSATGHHSERKAASFVSLHAHDVGRNPP